MRKKTLPSEVSLPWWVFLMKESLRWGYYTSYLYLHCVELGCHKSTFIYFDEANCLLLTVSLFCSPFCHCTKCFLQKWSKWIPPVVHTIEWFREGTFFIGGGGGGLGPRRGGSLVNFLQIGEGQTGFIPNRGRVSFFGMEKNYSMSLSWLLFVNKHAKCVET